MQKILISLVCLGVAVSFASQTAQPAEDAYRDAEMDEQTLKQMDLQRSKAPDYKVPSGYPDFGGRAWLIAEDFEAGMPGDWTIVDQNLDGTSWTTGVTTDLSPYDPPGYGTAYAYYSDDDAGSGAPAGNEYLISPAKYCGTYTGMEFDYSFGYDHLSTRAWCTVEARFHDGSTWGSWIQLAYYGGFVTNDTVGIQKFSFTPYLPADSVQVQFVWNEPGLTTWSWAFGVDNVFVGTPADHDVACIGVVSPPEGSISPGNYNVTGYIENFGLNVESFYVHGTVYDTDGMVEIYDDSVWVSGFAVGGAQNVTIGTATFPDDKNFLTEIYTALAGDEDPSNDMSSVESRTALGLGDIIFEMDAETPSGDLRCLGVEFDGTYFYVTGAGDYYNYSYVHVLDTAGNLICQPLQPNWCLYGWGLRDLADDGGDFNASVGYYVDGFDVDVPMGALTYTGSFPGPEAVQRALAYDPGDDVFFTANFSSNCWKFNRDWTVLQYTANTYAMYGAAYDTDYDEGGWVWWHSQDGTYPTYLQVEQMDAATMTFTGLNFNYYPAMQGGGYCVAGGMCFYEGFRGWDVLFTLVQGTPDQIVGIIVREHIPVADATIYFTPNTLNLGSQGTWVKGYVELEEGFDVYDIDPYSVRIEKIDGESITPLFCDGTGEVGDWDSDGILELQVKFDRGDLIDAMEGIVIPPAYAELYVRGDLTDADFGGAATIRVINPQTKHDGYMSDGNIPVAFAISEISPNPFRSKTVIRYALPISSQVKLTIYDANGRAVKGLVNNVIGAGYHNVYWNGQDDSGRIVSSGVYFLKFDTADYKTTRKLLFLR